MTKERAEEIIRKVIYNNAYHLDDHDGYIQLGMAIGRMEKQLEFELAKEAEVEPKKGKWIDVTNGRRGHECNMCHNYALNWKNGDENLSAYCPNCGADMRGEE